MRCEDVDAYPRALFVSEHGVQSLPRTLPRFVSRRELLPDVLASRLRHASGFEQMRATAHRLFPFLPPERHGDDVDNVEGYARRALVSQLAQATCLESALWSWRANGQTSGVLLWSLNDAWPGVSWSLLEWDGGWKAAMYRVKHAMAPVFARASLRGDVLEIACHTLPSLQSRLRASLTVERVAWGGHRQWPAVAVSPRTCDGGVVLTVPRAGADACRVTATWASSSTSLLLMGGERASTGAVDIVSKSAHGVVLHARANQALVWVDGADELGRFEPDNGFAMLANETVRLRFVPFADGDALDVARLRVWTMADLTRLAVA